MRIYPCSLVRHVSLRAQVATRRASTRRRSRVGVRNFDSCQSSGPRPNSRDIHHANHRGIGRLERGAAPRMSSLRECLRSEPCLRAHEVRFPWRGAVLERYSALRRLVQPRTRPLRIPGFLASHSHPHWPAVIDKLASRQLQARANPTHRPRPRRGSADLISFAVGTGSWCSGLTCQPVTLEIAGSNPVEPAISFLPAPSPPGRGSPLPHGRRLRTGPRAPAPAHRPPRTGPAYRPRAPALAHRPAARPASVSWRGHRRARPARAHTARAKKAPLTHNQPEAPQIRRDVTGEARG
jgi:hypothetical protein